MVSSVHYSPGSGRRYSRPFPPVPYLGYSDRHSHSSSHDTRSLQVTMTDQQLESDTAPQRKRIAVACGRCRKRKIRCSGDPGTGQPCSNCKNAGVDECLFLRVQSREAPMRVDPESFYSVGDARMYASRAAVTGNPNMPYAQDLPNLSSPDVVPSYRGNTYPYSATKQYYPAYGPPYADEFDYSIGVPSQPGVLGSHDPVGLLPGSHWTSRAKQTADSGYGNMMMSTEPSQYPYNSPSLVHRPAVSSDASNFSFSGVAASLPTTSSTERLLPNPNPTGRSATLPAPFLGGATGKTPASATTAASTATLADVAAAAEAASYAGGGYDTSGLPYSSIPSASTSTVGGALSSHHQQASVSRTPSSDSYSGGGESIFSEQERSLGTQGSDFDMNNFTAGPRRGSSSSGGHSSSTLSNGQTYVPSDGGSYDMHHPSVPSHHHAPPTVVGYAVAGSPTAATSSHGQEYRRSMSQSHQGHHHHNHHALVGGNTSSLDGHQQAAVGSRR